MLVAVVTVLIIATGVTAAVVGTVHTATLLATNLTGLKYATAARTIYLDVTSTTGFAAAGTVRFVVSFQRIN